MRTHPLSESQYVLWESVDEIDVALWNSIRDPEDIFMDPRLLRAIEQSMGDQSDIWYLLLRDEQGRPTAITCLSTWTVDAFILAEDNWSNRVFRQLQRLAPGLFSHKLLVSGMPMSAAQSYLRFAPHADRVAAFDQLDRLMHALARSINARCIVLKEFTDEELDGLQGFEQRSYHRVDSLPQNLIYPDQPTLTDYVEKSLDKKKRWSIRKTFKLFEAGGLVAHFTSDASEVERLYTNDVHAMYQAVYANAERKLELLPRRFFTELSRQLGENCNFCFLLKDEQVMAFICSIFSATGYYPLFVGFNYERNLEYGLYFNAMLRAFGDGLERGVPTIQVGQNADVFKQRNLGCHHERRHLLIKGVRAPMRLALQIGKRQVFPEYPLLGRKAG
ncbi:MAG: GNAT family N-acetyltransferase [Planctomycetaceae bacterium]|nr:GNAT family N-acetyltransferase [Planctomycetaceae bacterium]